MKRLIIKLLAAAAGIVLIVILALGAIYTFVYDSSEDFLADANTVRRAAVQELFRRGYVHEITSDDVRHIYESKCYRQCHGEAAMITAVLSPAGWIQVVERMRVKENVDISGREADVIIKHLEQKYPTAKTGYAYEVRKAVHQAVWRNDMGAGDIYCDVVYATPEYVRSIGAEHLVNEYELDRYHVFIVGFTVHDGEVELFELDKIAGMRMGGREISPEPPWILRFQTADKHHFEGAVRFKKSDGKIDDKEEWFELTLKDVGGEAERAYRWEMPIKYPQEIYVKREGGDSAK